MARRRRGNPVHGWVVLDKPREMTSTEAVSRVRRAFEAAKAGHAGTLDPLATGVLPIALGEATKVVAMVMDSTKRYRFTLRWGEERDTDDVEGAVTATCGRRPDEAAVEAVLPAFLGDVEQVPPTYSAIKVAGERAYDLARDGRPPDLAPRLVRIDALRLLAMPDRDHAVFEMTCGRGAYVRSLARDLGRRLDCLGHVSELRRTAVGAFTEARAIPLDKLDELRHKGALEQALLPVETALADIPALAVTGAEADRLKCGQAIRVPHKVEGTVYTTTGGRPVALARASAGEVRPVRVFNL
ncbi:MAG TPA: tRNA pseudouridine(55) synthase TruB [Alphaproteobacteria bacterium]|jgi:tRNA pseudouridine55 synthase|nr:tRNA pseudouridine(55) synthase TruB [Alphaproteobacteria bacterium]